MRGHQQLFFWLILMLVMAAGCTPIQSIRDKQTIVDLEKTLNAYENTLRWGRIENAFAFLDPEIFTQTSVPEGLDNIRVSEYYVINRPALLDENRATQSVKISYVLEDRQVEHSFIDNQQWGRKEGTELWYRTNPIPEFK